MRAAQAGAHIGGGSAAGGSRTRHARRPARRRIHGRRRPRPQRGKHLFQQIGALSCYAGLRARALMDAGNLMPNEVLAVTFCQSFPVNNATISGTIGWLNSAGLHGGESMDAGSLVL